MSNGKVMIIHLIAGLLKKIQCDSIGCNCIKISQYFPKPYEPFGGDINVKVDLSNYGTKADIKNISHVDTSGFASKTNLASLKTEVDKLNIDKLVPVLVDLSKLSDVGKMMLLKKPNMISQLLKQVILILAGLFQKLSVTQINQNQKMIFLILTVLLKRQIMMLNH